MKKKLAFPKEKIKIFLFEKIHEAAKETFEAEGYSITEIPKALQGDELREIVMEAHVLGVRSRTNIRASEFEHAKRLLCVGCFSVGTDQVDVEAGLAHGVPVFNAPHSSTRSVAELTSACILALARKLTDKSAAMHQGNWEKSAAGSFEVRQKTLGIIGYGHIGQQVGLLTEALGMNVVFYDILKKLPLGRARALSSKADVLSSSDYVSLHVPGTAQTRNMMGEPEFRLMRPGSYLLNLSRGEVVDLGALRAALISGHLAGAALDVYPQEPAANADKFACDVVGIPNVILTPHIGGSTEEAQRNIGIEVARVLIDFLDNGSTVGAVNFPSVHLPTFPDSHRILNIHRNVPGALSEINQVVAEVGANVDAQYLSTFRDLGYLIMDVNKDLSDEVRDRISVLPKSVKTRLLY